MIATAIVFGTLIHVGTHLACDFPRVIRAPPEKYILVARDFGSEKPSYTSLLSGVEGVTGIAMVILMSISFTLATHKFRKNGVRLPHPLNKLTGFNAFWYSHHLLALVYGLLLVHGYFMFLVHRWYQKTVRSILTIFCYFQGLICKMSSLKSCRIRFWLRKHYSSQLVAARLGLFYQLSYMTIICTILSKTNKE